MQTQKRNKYNWTLYVLLLVVILTGMGSNRVLETKAESVPEAVKNVESGVVKLVVYAVDEKGKNYYIRQGNGILIGDQTAQEKDTTILTDNSLVEANDTIYEKIKRKNGLSMDSSFTLSIDIVLDMGTRVSVEIVNTGDHYAILRPQSTLQDMQSLRLGARKLVKKDEVVYIPGYGGEENIINADSISNRELKEYSAKVEDVQKEQILLSTTLESGNIGAPVLDRQGYVIGINVQEEEGKLKVKPIDEIKQILTKLNITYQGIDKSTHYNEVTESVRKKFDQTLTECEKIAIHPERYTKKSISKLKTAINEAIQVEANAESTLDDYQNSIDALLKYQKRLHKKDFPLHIVQSILAVSILVFIILCIRTKIQLERLRTTGSIKNLSRKNKISKELAAPVRDTVVYARLIQKDTNEEIKVTKKLFRMGKSNEEIDYQIIGNSSISRHHADILVRNHEVLVVDHNSTNHTYINGTELTPGEYVPIKDGDILQLSNIRYIFSSN